MSEFKDKVVIVTGASSGIGRATAILFAEHGARVVIVGRDHARLAETQKLCVAVTKNEHIHQVHADVQQLEDLKKIVDDTLKAFGQIDVLVNNAGAGTTYSITTITNEVFEEMINLNARAPLFLTQYCTPHLEKTKGSIVNVSTVGCLVGQPAFIGYTMAKAALDQLTRSACAELGPKGITVNGVNPGLILTNFANAAGLPQEHFNAFESMILKRAPAGRAGEPREIAEVIAFLASKKTYVHGVNLLADGGIASVFM